MLKVQLRTLLAGLLGLRTIAGSPSWGGRYWRMQSHCSANFEVFGGSLQPLDFKTEI